MTRREHNRIVLLSMALVLACAIWRCVAGDLTGMILSIGVMYALTVTLRRA